VELSDPNWEAVRVAKSVAVIDPIVVAL